MAERIRVGGPRDLVATLDDPGSARGVVVAAPPHPQMGGSRSDRRLRAVSDGLADHGIACLRFDYGSWDEGRAERRDVLAALDWARREFDNVGAFGYSFGAGVTTLAVAESDDPPGVLAVLAPPVTIVDDGDTVAAVADVDCPALAVYGERDRTVDWEPVVDRAVDAGWSTEAVSGDHHFVGQHERVGALTATFLAGAFTDSRPS